VDDVGYITGAVRYLQQKYAVAPERTFGVGHSNGAIMMQTMSCLTDLFTEVATLAGTLMVETPSCPAARNHTIYNYHGALDENLPITGGSGTKGVTNIHFTSQARAKALFDGLTIGERLARDLRLGSGTDPNR